MMKKTLAMVVAGAFAAASVYADCKACCGQGATSAGKTECSNSVANLDLTKEQKAKLAPLQAKCAKAGCTKESTANFLKEAKGILSAKQYATLKAECEKSAHHAAKT